MNLKIQNISKNYKNLKALDDVNLEFSSGLYLLIGPNGSGKSTLINIMVGLIKPDNGTVLSDNINIVSDRDGYYSKIGYMPQYPQFYNNYTVLQFLEYMSLIKGLKEEFYKKQIDELIKDINLVDKRDVKIRNLSGGMKQRLGIATALIGNPELVILDEPTAGLDPIERRRFAELIRRKSKDRIVIIATHMISEVNIPEANFIFLKKGHLVNTGNIDDITKHGRYKTIEDVYIDVFGEKEHESDKLWVKKDF